MSTSANRRGRGPRDRSNYTDVGVIRDQLINFMFAARDSVSLSLLIRVWGYLKEPQIASLLAFTIYAFTQHPEIAIKARAEVLEHIGPDGTASYEELKKLTYRKTLSPPFFLPSISQWIKYKLCSMRPSAYSRLCMQAGGNPSQRGYYSPLPIPPTHEGHCTSHLTRHLSIFPF